MISFVNFLPLHVVKLKVKPLYLKIKNMYEHAENVYVFIFKERNKDSIAEH